MQFGSDNQTGASEQVLKQIVDANNGHTHGYGDDDWSTQAKQKLNAVFESDAEIFFVATGTAANSLSLASLVKPWETILCHHQAHVLVDESTAPAFFTGGANLIAVSRQAGKLHPAHLQTYFDNTGTDAPHNPRAAALSLAQVNECGQVYSVEELKALTDLAHQHQLKVHMDGARFANALAAQQCTPAELTWKAGIDVLCLGATKCGCLSAEAVIFFDRELAKDFEHRCKRSGHLLSKGRFLAAQFHGWLENDHWLALAEHANQHAQKLAQGLQKIAGVRMAWPADANELFVILPQTMSDRLQQAGAEFYEWYAHALPPHEQLMDDEAFVRLVTSFKTTDAEVSQFLELAGAG